RRDRRRARTDGGRRLLPDRPAGGTGRAVRRRAVEHVGRARGHAEEGRRRGVAHGLPPDVVRCRHARRTRAPQERPRRRTRRSGGHAGGDRPPPRSLAEVIPGRRAVLVMALALVAAAGATAAQTERFPKVDRPVAPIITPSYSTEAARDAHGEAM